MTHYEILGVAKDATAAEIKKAYRKKASKAHSDRDGGSDELMAKINVAYEVLSDPERRANYDATGRDQIDNLENAASELVVSKVAEFLQTPGSENYDMIQHVRQELETDKQKVFANRTKGQEIIARLDRTLAALTYKGKGADKIGDMLRHQKQHIEGQLLRVAEDLKKIDLAIELLKFYDYKSSPVYHTRPTMTGMMFVGGHRFP